MKKKVLLIFGTRPEGVKMGPVYRALEKSMLLEPLVCVTAQHREMLDQVLHLFGITPDRDLDLMRPKQTLAGLTAEAVTALSSAIAEMRPDCVLVHGDTTTTACASLAAYYNRVPIGHVEAGLRSGDKYAPWPEEVNRKIAGAISDFHFAPTERARANLLAEGIRPEFITVTGNTVVDALVYVRARLTGDPGAKASLQRAIPGLELKRKLVLVTAHRRESFGTGIENICRALERIASAHQDVQIVFPVHRNPNVMEPVHRILGDSPHAAEGRILLVPPLDYMTFVHAMSLSSLVISDSGGVQEEAPSFNVPVLVLRDTTERPEDVEAGVCLLVGTDSDRIVTEATARLGTTPPRAGTNPYGTGDAATRIIKFLERNIVV